jgi:transposase
MSYDKKIRAQAVKYCETHTQAETSEVFGVSVSAIKDWQKLLKTKGNLEKAPLKRSGRKIKEEAIRADVEKYPDDFNRERAKRFDCTAEGIRLALKRHEITRKKRV